MIEDKRKFIEENTILEAEIDMMSRSFVGIGLGEAGLGSGSNKGRFSLLRLWEINKY